MSETGTIGYRREGATAFITFDRPARRNALTWEMFDALDDAVTRLHEESGLRVAVLRGEGGHFVAGTDIAQFAAFGSPDDGVVYERRIEQIVARLETVPVATIAAVQGAAVGAGLLIAAVCDIRVCSTDAYFGAPIARTVGNCLSIESMARLVAHFGPARTLALLITAGRLGADDALRAGFVADILSADAMDAHVAALCDRIAGHAPITLRVTREAVRRLTAAGIPAAEDLIREAYGSRDFQEGVSAFLEKREPRWTGT